MPAQPSHDFWNRIFTIFDNNKFNISEAERADPISYIKQVYNGPGVPTSKHALMTKAHFTQDTYDELRLKHGAVLKQLPNGLHQSTYKKNSRGIVLIGGGWYSWLSYLSLVSLRETGSKLPVEFILPTFHDYEQEYDFCHNVLPKLDASCVVVAEKLGTAVTRKWLFGSYQYKALAIIASTFQHVILLDSDNILVKNPDSIFTSTVYKKHGLITWPDYWKRTISPFFYSVAGLRVNEKLRTRYDRFPLITPVAVNETEQLQVPYHDLDGAIPDLSTESGQLIVNKKTHGKALLVALYYNVFGPGYFYKLFSLGELGEGDKDTFVTAAMVVRKPHYQVKSYIRTVGYNDDSSFHGLGMGQKDPIMDYNVFTAEMKNLLRLYHKKDLPMDKQISLLKNLEDNVFSSSSNIPLFAVHCNVKKVNPVDFMESKEIYNKKEHRLNVRMFSGLTYVDDRGDQPRQVDFEYMRWSFMDRILCEDEVKFSTFENANMTKLCLYLKNTVKWLAQPAQI
ncbi:glycosyltransferase family 71 protein [Suhomyces tanzawaensis NRRL Y-17324]|uniref:Glycosyltransferase family 71 protein n=1 Tax=Suhomyces tanzawaensis NRRL Y-17324 TaxID=984487 RepID=A0A1E4SE52_9ASCO|nr:glycosyltransferase family 71 protein [Suhomyces tanzawaensis NRRL Y-17324]ODV77799.1 glycosyltransferase family 71 protein [Suhomyces tanzawaensis NRRL Y-17324]